MRLSRQAQWDMALQGFGDFDVDLVIYSNGNSTIPITTIIIMQVVCYNNCQKV